MLCIESCNVHGLYVKWYIGMRCGVVLVHNSGYMHTIICVCNFIIDYI